MKIWTDGAKHTQGQLPRIEQGFIELGHELTAEIENADLVYVNNCWYDLAIEAKRGSAIKGKMIFTVLDLAPHLGNQFPLEKLKEQLGYADAICTISETVQKDLLARGGFDSTVIYQPIKRISKNGDKLLDSPRALFVGRINDGNKRSGIAAEALLQLGFKSNEIITVGSDVPFFGGIYAGVVNDGVLNELYSAVDFVMCCSRHEGILLPAIEAMAAGAIPVICNDLSTRQDFFNGISEYDDVQPNPASIAGFMAGYINNPEKMQAFKDKLHKHYQDNLAYKMSGVGVAEAILKVYDGLR